MRDLMHGRDSENMDMFQLFIYFCLQHIKSKIDSEYERQHVSISNFLFVHDESYIILLMMNSGKEIKMMARQERIPRGDRKTSFSNCIVDERDVGSDNSANANGVNGMNSESVSSIGTNSIVGVVERR